MEYMLVSTEKYIFFQSRNLGIWALPIPGFGIKKNVRDPGIRDPGITIPTGELTALPRPSSCLTGSTCNGQAGGRGEGERKGTGGLAPFRRFLDALRYSGAGFLQFFSNRANRQMLISVTCSDL